MPASSRLRHSGQKKELLGPALFCSHPWARADHSCREPSHSTASTMHGSCFGGGGGVPKTGMLCLGGSCMWTSPSTRDSDLISEKCSFQLQRLERLVLTSSSCKGWFPRIRPVTEKTHSHFWQQLKILDSSLCFSVPQFPFSQLVLVTTSQPHTTKINACKLPFILLHASVQRSRFFVVIVQHNNNIKYHMLHEIKLWEGAHFLK